MLALQSVGILACIVAVVFLFLSLKNVEHFNCCRKQPDGFFGGPPDGMVYMMFESGNMFGGA
jgi:hypothetical protein